MPFSVPPAVQSNLFWPIVTRIAQIVSDELDVLFLPAVSNGNIWPVKPYDFTSFFFFFFLVDRAHLWLGHPQLIQRTLFTHCHLQLMSFPLWRKGCYQPPVFYFLKINPILLFRISRSPNLYPSLIESVSLFCVISKFHYYSSYFCTYIINGNFWLNKYLLMS